MAGGSACKFRKFGGLRVSRNPHNVAECDRILTQRSDSANPCRCARAVIERSAVAGRPIGAPAGEPTGPPPGSPAVAGDPTWWDGRVFTSIAGRSVVVTGGSKGI